MPRLRLLGLRSSVHKGIMLILLGSYAPHTLLCPVRPRCLPGIGLASASASARPLQNGRLRRHGKGTLPQKGEAFTITSFVLRQRSSRQNTQRLLRLIFPCFYLQIFVSIIFIWKTLEAPKYSRTHKKHAVATCHTTLEKTKYG